MAQDRRDIQTLYDNLGKEYDMGEYGDFEKRITSDERARQYVYGLLKDSDNDIYGSYEAFSDKMKVEEPKAEQTQKVDTQPAKVEQDQKDEVQAPVEAPKEASTNTVTPKETSKQQGFGYRPASADASEHQSRVREFADYLKERGVDVEKLKGGVDGLAEELSTDQGAKAWYDLLVEHGFGGDLGTETDFALLFKKPGNDNIKSTEDWIVDQELSDYDSFARLNERNRLQNPEAAERAEQEYQEGRGIRNQSRYGQVEAGTPGLGVLRPENLPTKEVSWEGSGFKGSDKMEEKIQQGMEKIRHINEYLAKDELARSGVDNLLYDNVSKNVGEEWDKYMKAYEANRLHAILGYHAPGSGVSDVENNADLINRFLSPDRLTDIVSNAINNEELDKRVANVLGTDDKEAIAQYKDLYVAPQIQGMVREELVKHFTPNNAFEAALEQGVNSSLVGLGYTVANRDNEAFMLKNYAIQSYDAPWYGKILSTGVSFLMDAPAFAIGGGLGSKAATAMFGKKISQELIKTGFKREVANAIATRSIAAAMRGAMIKYGIGAVSTGVTFGFYDTMQDIASQLAYNEDGKWHAGQTLLHGALGTVKGALFSTASTAVKGATSGFTGKVASLGTEIGVFSSFDLAGRLANGEKLDMEAGFDIALNSMYMVAGAKLSHFVQHPCESTKSIFTRPFTGKMPEFTSDNRAELARIGIDGKSEYELLRGVSRLMEGLQKQSPDGKLYLDREAISKFMARNNVSMDTFNKLLFVATGIEPRGLPTTVSMDVSEGADGYTVNAYYAPGAAAYRKTFKTRSQAESYIREHEEETTRSFNEMNFSAMKVGYSMEMAKVCQAYGQKLSAEGLSEKEVTQRVEELSSALEANASGIILSAKQKKVLADNDAFLSGFKDFNSLETPFAFIVRLANERNVEAMRLLKALYDKKDFDALTPEERDAFFELGHRMDKVTKASERFNREGQYDKETLNGELPEEVLVSLDETNEMLNGETSTAAEEGKQMNDEEIAANSQNRAEMKAEMERQGMGHLESAIASYAAEWTESSVHPEVQRMLDAMQDPARKQLMRDYYDSIVRENAARQMPIDEANANADSMETLLRDTAGAVKDGDTVVSYDINGETWVYTEDSGTTVILFNPVTGATEFKSKNTLDIYEKRTTPLKEFVKSFSEPESMERSAQIDGLTEQPVVEQPAVEKPAVEQPKAAQADVEHPVVEQPKEEVTVTGLTLDEKGHPIIKLTGEDKTTPEQLLGFYENDERFEPDDITDILQAKLNNAQKKKEKASKVKRPKATDAKFKGDEFMFLDELAEYKRNIAESEAEVKLYQDMLDMHRKNTGQTTGTESSLVVNGVPDVTKDSPKGAAERGYIMVNGERVDRSATLVEGEDVIYGKETDVIFGNGEGGRQKGRYALVREDRLQGSHIRGQRNPMHFFIDDAQPKEVFGADRMKIADDIADNPDLRIMVGEDAYSGSEVVNERGEVIQGNGRDEGLRRMTPKGREKYEQMFRENASRFGFKPEDLKEGWRLTRIVPVDDQRARDLGKLNRDNLESGGEQHYDSRSVALQVLERGKADDVVSRLFSGADEDSTLGDMARKNADSVIDYLLANDLITLTQAETARKNKGTEAMRELLIDIMLGDVPANVRDIVKNMPDAKLSALATAVGLDMGVSADAKLVPEIRAALQMLGDVDSNTLSKNAETIRVWLNQQAAGGMFDKSSVDVDPRVVELALHILKDKPRALNEAVRKYYESVGKESAQGEMDFGEGTKKLGKQDAMKESFPRFSVAEGEGKAEAPETPTEYGEAYKRIMGDQMAYEEHLRQQYPRVQKALEENTRGLDGVRIINSVEEIENEATRADVEAKLANGERPEAWVEDDGTVVFFTPCMRTYDAARFVERKIAHEVYTHRGLSGLLGKDYESVLGKVFEGRMTAEDREDFAAYVWNENWSSARNRRAALVGEENAGKSWAELSAEQREAVLRDARLRAEAADEWSANRAENDDKVYEQDWFQSLITSVRRNFIKGVKGLQKALGKTPEDYQMTYDDWRQLMASAKKESRKWAQAEGDGKRFSMENIDDKEWENFVSILSDVSKRKSPSGVTEALSDSPSRTEVPGYLPNQSEIDGAKVKKISKELKDLSEEIDERRLGPNEMRFRLAKALQIKEPSSDKTNYAIVDITNGTETTVRIADHSADSNNFGRTDNNIGIVIKTSNNRFRSADDKDYIEFLYYGDKVAGNAGLQKNIVDGLRHYIETGSFEKMPKTDRLSSSGAYSVALKNSVRDKISKGQLRFSLADGNDSESVRYSVRTKESPKKTKKAYKLMRLGEDGNLYPLFIGGTEVVHLGTWYDADAPDLTALREAGNGDWLIDMTTGELKSYADYAKEHNITKRTKPNLEDVEWAADNGMRFMNIKDGGDKVKNKYGDSKQYHIWGINGSAKDKNGKGSASPQYAFRPGWHFGDTPSMHQIGYMGEDGKKNMRLDNQVWVEVEMAADVDYNAEAKGNASGDIPTHIPTDGYYEFATNPLQQKAKDESKNLEKGNWYVAGAFKPVRILSDHEADDIVRKYNEETGKQIPLDYRRKGGRMFNAETMQLEDAPTDKTDLFAHAESVVKNSRRYSMADDMTDLRNDLVEANNKSREERVEAMHAIGGKLSHLRSAMSKQRAYDKKTVKEMTDLVQDMIKDGLIDEPGKGEVKQLLSAVKNATGKEDLTRSVNKVMDIMLKNQLRHMESDFRSLLKTKSSKVGANGVLKQGEVDADTGVFLKSVVEYIGKDSASLKTLQDELNDELYNEDGTISRTAQMHLSAARFAQRYKDFIEASKEAEQSYEAIKEKQKKLFNLGKITSKEYQELLASVDDAIRRNKADRVEMYKSFNEQLAAMVAGGKEAAKAWINADIERVNEIRHNLNSDMEGRSASNVHKPFDDKFWHKMANSDIARAILMPLESFDQMLRMIGSKSPNGEGYAWNRYMRGFVNARNTEITGIYDTMELMDNEASKVMGKKVRWTDLFDMSRKGPKIKLAYKDGTGMVEQTLTQGNALYVYMVNKMADGRMKLRAMGISEEAVEQMAQQIDPRFIELGDWMQEVLLPKMRTKYNQTHRRMFGADMASIENYFPLRINESSLSKEEDITKDDLVALPGTTTSGVIERTVNVNAIDILGSDAFSVMTNHLQEMEHWNAFAEYTRDINTMLSYGRFKNQLHNMTSVYGSGKDLVTTFRDMCKMAVGAYRPERPKIDAAAVSLAMGATAAKVAFRPYTALKQMASFPAYFPETNPLYLIKSVGTAKTSWDWCIANLPMFRYRWESRLAGDPRLMQESMNFSNISKLIKSKAGRIGMLPNAFVDATTVAIGAKAKYDTNYRRYRQLGFDHEYADERAKQDATIMFNESQQSSEGAFVSRVQVDRTWLASMISAFRNASMSYTRQGFDASRNSLRMLSPKYRKEAQEFLVKQLMRDGLDEYQAVRGARKQLRDSPIRDAARIAVFCYGLQLMWNLTSSIPYLIFGDDKDKKQKYVADAARQGVFGSIEGLTLGDVMSNAGDMALSGEFEEYRLSKNMPVVSDINTIINEFKNNKDAEAWNDVVNVFVQTFAGMNPETMTDWVAAAMDISMSNPDKAHEFALFVNRVFNVPQSQLKEIFFDELNCDAKTAQGMTPEQLAERYANYKAVREAPLTGWIFKDANRETTDKQKKRLQTTWRAELEMETDGENYEELEALRQEVGKHADELSKLKSELKIDHPKEYAEKKAKLDKTREGQRYKCYNHFQRLIDEQKAIYVGSKDLKRVSAAREKIKELKQSMLKELYLIDNPQEREDSK